MFDINDQLSGGFPPGGGGFGSPFEMQRQQAYANLQGFYGISGQGPMGVPAWGQPSLGGQITQWAGQQFGPMGQAVAQFAMPLAQGLIGVNPNNLMPFGQNYNPGQFLLRQAPSTVGIPEFDPINYQTMNLQQFQQLQNKNQLFDSVFSLTSGFAEFSQTGEEGQLKAGQTAAEITNFLRSKSPAARMAYGMLEHLGIDDPYSVVAGSTTTANQFMGRARFMRGGPDNKAFSQYLSEGMIERVDDSSSGLHDVGFRRSGEALQTLGASRMLDVGG